MGSPQFLEKLEAPEFRVIPGNVPDLTLYSFNAWPLHARSIETNPSGTITLHSFFTSPQLRNWERMLQRYPAVSSRIPFSPFDFNYRIGDTIKPIEAEKAFPSGGPLYYAAYLGFTSVMALLLESGKDPDEYGGEFHYPILAAAENGHKEAVNLLLDANADVTVRGPAGQTLLHSVLGAGWWDIARHVIKMGANIDVVDEHGCTPLLVAALKGFEGDLSLLISDNTINRENSRGRTPLLTAVTFRRFNQIPILIKKGCKVTMPSGIEDFNFTPLHCAMAIGSPQLIRLLLQAGGDPFAQSSMGRIPLHVALENRFLQSAKEVKAWMDGAEDVREIKEIPTESLSVIEAHALPEEIQAFIEEFAKEDDYCMHNVLAIQCFDRGEIERAVTLFDKTVEYYPKNKGVKRLDQLHHPCWCNHCQEIIVGCRYLERTSDPDGNLLRSDLYKCRKCFVSDGGDDGMETDSGIQIVSVPSQQWIKLHLDTENGAIEGSTEHSKDFGL